MNPLATVCSICRAWLTPTATRSLASVRHAEDFGNLLGPVAAAQAMPDDGPAVVVEERINGKLERISGDVRCSREARNGGSCRGIWAAGGIVLVLQQLSLFERKLGECVAF